MSYRVVQTRRFARQYKKLHDNIITDVDQAVDSIANNPDSVNRRKAIYRSCVFTSFAVTGNCIYIGYTLDDAIQLVYLEAIGSHENFYRDLKR